MTVKPCGPRRRRVATVMHAGEVTSGWAGPWPDRIIKLPAEGFKLGNHGNQAVFDSRPTQTALQI